MTAAALDAAKPDASADVRAPSGVGPVLQQGSIALVILIAFLGLYIGLQRDPSPAMPSAAPRSAHTSCHLSQR